MTIETLITKLGFEADLSGLKRYQSSLNTLETNIGKMKSEINIDTRKSVHNIEVLKDRVIQLATVTGTTVRTLHKLGKFSAGVVGSVAKIAGAGIGAGVGATAVNAKSVSEVAKLADGYGTTYQYVVAIKQGLADIKFDHITDMMEEFRNKVQLSVTSLDRDIKSGASTIGQYDISGYTDAKGKHKDAKRIEESTLNDFFATTLGNGDLGKVDSSFKGVLNTAKALKILEKKTGEERFNIMLKLVDLNKNYISSIDDFLSGESQRMMTQLLVRAKDAKTSVYDLVQKQRSQSFINDKDVENIIRYNNSMESLGRSLKGVFDRATAGVGEIIAPYIQQFADYIQSHKEQIRTFINEAVMIVKNKIMEIKEYITTSDIFVNADGSARGFRDILSSILSEIEERVRVFVQVVGAIMIGLSALFLAGGPLGLAIVGLSALFVANFDKIKNVVSSSVDWVVKKVNIAVQKLKELAGIGGKAKDIGVDNHSTKASNSLGIYGAGAGGFTPPKLPNISPSGASSNVINNISTPITVNVAGTNASAGDIAEAVHVKLSSSTSSKFNQTYNNTPPIK